MATLKAEHLAKSYKNRKVVADVSLQVESGQIVGLLGPNGAGKTTSFYMIVGLVARDEGKILIDEEDISLLPMHSRSRMVSATFRRKPLSSVSFLLKTTSTQYCKLVTILASKSVMTS